MLRTPFLEDRSAESSGVPRNADVEIVVVIPTFRHSVFVADAVDSVVAQDTRREIRIVIVDDGCPFDATRRIVTVLAAAYPDRVEYIRRQNGGLSAARNTGIDYALSRWPSVRAIYFLDADNMVEPQSIERAYTVLMSDSSVGWVYPDIIMFGSENTYWDYRSPYSVLGHLKVNLCEAASMVRRDVFDRGCRYDESMRLGYEDWEFWWQCIEAGFLGRHVPFFGLRYRKRPESMLTEASREHEGVMLYMQRKHKSLFRAKRLFAFDTPRYAILVGNEQAKLCSDMRDGGETIDRLTLIDRMIAARHQPHLYTAPRYLIGGSELCLDTLVRVRLDRYVLWWIEQCFFNRSDVHVAAVQVAIDPSFAEVTVRPLAPDCWPASGEGIHLMALRPSVLNECVEDASVVWIKSLLTDRAYPTASVLRIELPATQPSDIVLREVIFQWFDFFKQLRLGHTQMKVSAPLPVGKRRSIPPHADNGAIASELLNCGPLFYLPAIGNRDIAFVVPLLNYGGVEKVALHMAEQFHRRGWRCHLVVLAQQANIGDFWLSIFDSISFYHEDALYEWSDAAQYMGTTYPKWVTTGDSRPLEGLLLAMDAVVNFHVAALHKILHKLRKAGTVTAASVHVKDLSGFGREVGHVFLTLGYEHVYDFIAPCSQMLLDDCNAFGVPQDKLVLVPNAPCHTVADTEIAEILARRLAKAGDSPRLNVAFIGRFDRQKGINRLIATVHASRALDMPIVWRIVGSSVIEASEASGLREFVEFVEPAIHDQKNLTDLYEWADVLYMPSLWEGLPLTIMEAARLGVVPVAANVGAVAEIVEHQRTGWLLDDATTEGFAASAIQALDTLAGDRMLLTHLSRQASDAMTRTWEASCEPFIGRVEGLIAARANQAASRGNR